MIQILRTETKRTISGEAGGERPDRLEDYLVTKLIDFPEVDYDTHAATIYDLAGQVVAHFRAKYPDEDQLRTVLQGHAKQLAEAVFAQMKGNMWRDQANYRVTVTAAFENLRPQTFDGSSQETVRDFRQAPERLSDIKRFIFGGFKKCCYQMAKFDSDTERKMAVLLEQDSTVQLWMKPGPNQFKVYDADGLPYQPDFVVETDSDKLIIETKRQSEMNDVLVKRKADAASLWAFIATEFHGKTVSDKPWSYLLVPEDSVRENATVKGLQASHTRIADTDLRARYELANG
jgi:type III restriction enzyme